MQYSVKILKKSTDRALEVLILEEHLVSFKNLIHLQHLTL